ncbi:MAG: methyltransferase domain-containing protein [Ktedonobacteraceae bacterium]|nr:methyltransferase domain-containing protein [Ktedonobacteraceae bacterium]
MSSDSHRQHPSTYVVQAQHHQEELTRLHLQDELMTACMGGVLSEQPDPTSLQRVLDIGCGTGGWLIETAKRYPGIQLLIGVDINNHILDYARLQTDASELGSRVEFHQMDALRTLEFPDAYFDLVNQRFAQGYLRTWDWAKLLQEAQRVARPGGIIRLTEAKIDTNSSSPALNRLNRLCIQSLYQAGHYFTPDEDGITARLPELMRQYGVRDIQTRTYMVEQHASTSGGQLYMEDMRLMYRVAVPFMKRWVRLPDDYEELYQQALVEMQSPDFLVTVKLLTVWGRNEAPQESSSE